MADRMHDYAEDPLERLGARSLADADRTSKPVSPPARRSLFPWLLTTGAVAFALGLVANPWFESSVRSSLPGQFQEFAGASVLPDLAALEARVAALEAVPSADRASVAAPLPAASGPRDVALLSARVAKLEADAGGLASADTRVAARIDRLATELATSTSADAADRAALRDLFLLSAARRSVETGRPFGSFERSLAAAFSARDRSATDALLAWSSAPQTRRSLLSRLQAPADEPLAAPRADASWWDRLLARISGVVQVRSNDGLGAEPEISDKAAKLLGEGELARAMAALELAPASAARDLWLADAARLLAAEQALERLEALLLAGPTVVSVANAVPQAPPVNALPAEPQGTARPALPLPLPAPGPSSG